jgi:hypothetical protein
MSNRKLHWDTSDDPRKWGVKWFVINPHTERVCGVVEDDNGRSNVTVYRHISTSDDFRFKLGDLKEITDVVEEFASYRRDRLESLNKGVKGEPT